MALELLVQTVRTLTDDLFVRVLRLKRAIIPYCVSQSQLFILCQSQLMYTRFVRPLGYKFYIYHIVVRVVFVGGKAEAEVGIARLVAHLAEGDHGFILHRAFAGGFVCGQFEAVDNLILIVQDVLELEATEVERDVEVPPIASFLDWDLVKFELPIGKIDL